MNGTAENQAVPGESWIPSSKEDRREVSEQLVRLLAGPEFGSSKRYANFLNFTVEHALLHPHDALKERIVGAEVFGRSPGYDTNSDPIVRVTATEIRKRIARYYSNLQHSGEIRILLPTGSYIPIFAKPGTGNGNEIAEEIKSEETVSAHLDPHSAEKVTVVGSNTPAPFTGIELNLRRRPIRRWITVVSTLAIVVATCLSIILFWHHSEHSEPSALDKFWSPVLQSKEPVLICVADQPQLSKFSRANAHGSVFSPASRSDSDREPTTMAISDTVPLMAVIELLHSHNVDHRVKRQTLVSLSDLRQGPDVLVGAFDNSWTLRLMQGLRFHFSNSSDNTHLWIEDSDHPDQKKWELNAQSVPNAQAYTDYALIARFFDTLTGQHIVVAAGLGNNGTAAAGEFLSDQQMLQELERSAPSHWESKNVEIVISTNVIDGQYGSPHILSAIYW